MQNLFTHYDAFYNMMLSSAVMTNTYSQDAIIDCRKIISFIGKAWGVSNDYIEDAVEVILNRLSPISTVQDLAAFDGSKSHDAEYSDLDRYAEVKNDVITTLENLRKHTYLENPGWVDYTHLCVYQQNIRYRKLAEHSVTGDLISTRQVGILLALGIGCERDLASASRKLLQCALWGDATAAKYLAYVASLSGDEKRAAYLAEYSKLVEIYLDDGITVLPDNVKEQYSDEACVLYVYTSSIKYDVVYSHSNHKIDFSFLEVIMSDDIPYDEKITYIDEYERKLWKKCTNKVPASAKLAKIGF